MRINCVSCGHRFELDAAYDDYSGLVKCSICRTLLQIQAVEGRLKSVCFPGMSNNAPVAPHAPVTPGMGKRAEAA